MNMNEYFLYDDATYLVVVLLLLVYSNFWSGGTDVGTSWVQVAFKLKRT